MKSNKKPIYILYGLFGIFLIIIISSILGVTETIDLVMIVFGALIPPGIWSVIRLGKKKGNLGNTTDTLDTLGSSNQSNTINVDDNYDPHFLEGFNRFRNGFLIRSLIFNVITAGTFLLGLYLYNYLDSPSGSDDVFAGILIGSMILVGIYLALLNIPLVKLKKELLSTFAQHPQFTPIDVSPVMTFFFCTAGLIFSIPTTDYVSNSTNGIDLWTIFLGFLYFVIFLVSYWLTPFKMLEQVKKKTNQANYEF
ncbi:MAG: hypothetical protein ACTSRK_10455 [Promethearchaeota archaeon]